MVICFSVTKNRKQWRRKNGWSVPLHPLQVSAWVFIVMFALLYFGVLVPNLPSGAWQISAHVINSIVFLVHIVIHLISVTLDPADVNVRAKHNSGPLPAFDRKKHSHVIENQYCHICEVKVGSRSKHCSSCNKCVSEFDHHCKWLNNCVGGRNYQLFLSCITSALLGCSIIFILSIALIAAFFDSSSWLYATLSGEESVRKGTTQSPLNIHVNNTSDIMVQPTSFIPIHMSSTLPSHNNTITKSGNHFVAFVSVHSTAWVIIVMWTATLSFIGIALLGHLLGFHIFLMCQNFSTYDYIVQKRDSDSNAPLANNQSQQQPKILHLPFRLLQQLRPKKANQITPESKQSNRDRGSGVELELQTSSRRRSSEGKTPMLPVIENCSSNEENREETQLENYIGNVYIGSPHRRRHYLEPLHLRPKSSNTTHDDSENQESLKNEITSVEVIENNKEVTSTDDNIQEKEKDLSQMPTYNHGLLKRPPPATLLSPILESEISTGSAIVSWKHRSVSEQSLQMATEDEEDDYDDAQNASSSSLKGEKLEKSSMTLSKENSGSLSNLFVSANEQTEVIIETNNNCPEAISEIEDDDRVHEVHIIPQGSFNGFKDHAPLESSKADECNDPFINGELWAYAPRNGYHLPGGIVSFRRSCSMQDECVNKSLQNHLTRCRSEDEIKHSPKIVKLQRRMSEDQVSWLVQDQKLSKKLKEGSPKSGISATAVFCVEEQEDSFAIPNVVFSGKRKYGHFAVPSHVVLPCANFVHPESRIRTRPVGSKPPKAFHA